MKKLGAVAAALILLALAGPVSEGMAQECFSRGAGRQMLENREIVPLPEALRRAGVARNRLVGVELCRAGGGFIYRVRVLGPAGRVRHIDIPAG